MEGGGLGVCRVAANRASTDTGSVEGGGLGVCPVAANCASTDAGSVEGGGLGVCRVAPNRTSTDSGSVEGGELVVRRVAPIALPPRQLFRRFDNARRDPWGLFRNCDRKGGVVKPDRSAKNRGYPLISG